MAKSNVIWSSTDPWQDMAGYPSLIGPPTTYQITDNTAVPNPQQKNHMNGNLVVNGDIIVNGRNISKMLDQINSRLAILEKPDPRKLEKFAALKKAYDHYKVLEALLKEDQNNQF